MSNKKERFATTLLQLERKPGLTSSS